MTEDKKNAASGSSLSLDAILKRRRASIIEVVDAKSAVDLATAQSYSENVFLFIPNLIGEFTSTPPGCLVRCRVAWPATLGSLAPAFLHFSSTYGY